MKNVIFLCGLIMLPASALHAAEENYKIDSEHTYPYFAISHLGFSTMQGRFNKTTGSITLDQKSKTGRVDINIDAASIDTGHKKRDEHLRGPDFLNVIEFPEITYKSNKITINADDSAVAEGTLTIMGSSQPVTLQVSHIHCGVHPFDPSKKKFVCGFDATATIKRSDFGVTYGTPNIGDKMELTFAVEAVRQ
ncbi:MAG: polyisoprenoid-binding protein [Gammaproteobacteria bacterium]|nr:polyisoprenoid-binding protein [Gammaproteobacteria bacterium]